MELILWRHAEAEDGVPDAERKLTNKGLRQANSMANWLKEKLPENSRVIVSPTKRTQQTAMALGYDFETSREIAPGASADMILAAVGWPDEDCVVVVGHQPTLGEVAALLLFDYPGELSVKKGAIWWFSCKKTQRTKKIVLRTAISPDML